MCMSEQLSHSQWISERITTIRELLLRRQYQDVIDESERFLANDETNIEVWKLRVEALLSLGRIEQARLANDRALKLYPDDAMLWNDKAMLLYAEGLYFEALRVIGTAIKRDDNNGHI